MFLYHVDPNPWVEIFKKVGASELRGINNFDVNINTNDIEHCHWLHKSNKNIIVLSIGRIARK